MVVIAKTSNKLIRIREFHIDYVGHAHVELGEFASGLLDFAGQLLCLPHRPEEQRPVLLGLLLGGSSCPECHEHPTLASGRERTESRSLRLLHEVTRTMSVQFAVLASGSRGNSTLIQGRNGGLLIDAGMGPRTMAERLESVGANWSVISAVVLTHTHTDHVDTATFAELARRRVVLYCHEAHREHLAGDPGFEKLLQAGLCRLYDDCPFLTTNGLRIEPIRLRHDGGPTFGFRIEVSAERRERPVMIGYLADTGCWSEAMAESLADVDVLGVEFNHDVAMQKASGRPSVLIARNLGDQGHLSNRQGAELVQRVLQHSGGATLRHVVLLHLSEDCNEPALAVQAARQAIEPLARRVEVHAARQNPAHPNLWIGPDRRTGRPAAATASGRGPTRSKRPSSDGENSLGLMDLFGGDSEPDGGAAGVP
jgi:phosphoribosyl 1,2-cyclic phosphodiesterase